MHESPVEEYVRKAIQWQVARSAHRLNYYSWSTRRLWLLSAKPLFVFVVVGWLLVVGLAMLVFGIVVPLALLLALGVPAVFVVAFQLLVARHVEQCLVGVLDLDLLLLPSESTNPSPVDTLKVIELRNVQSVSPDPFSRIVTFRLKDGQRVRLSFMGEPWEKRGKLLVNTARIRVELLGKSVWS